ncbi:DUF4843 domain-containing protein [Sphingobacterium faecale]|uniref:DUF4843 domain-containing protein n=1 Tax=Sphingobacterium faecale TaxID=2803775 RepID=A0ABS1R418_9SPHI|nr:DUF4843 domain-containing protein [Sphingobacterium faecale]MBL1409452.1 DUF4843 domain-containing protein [Sphingobacterium faecale]
MKQLSNIILLFIFLIGVIACEKDLHSFDVKPAVYFNETARLPLYQNEVLRDSTIISFGLSGNTVVDSIIPMVVTCIGAKESFDRPYELQIDSKSTAVEGVHYQIMNNEYSIKKNRLQDTVFLKIFRLEEMKTKEYTLFFSLLDNDNFSTSMKEKVRNPTTGEKISFVTYKWYLNDIVRRPGRWLDGFLGPFSRKKLYLMVDVLGIEAEYLDKNVSIAETNAYGQYMQRYLNEQAAQGNIILDEDDQPMVMGSSVQ